MWHSPLVEWKHALAKQCGLDLVFPCIIMKMFVSAIVSLLLLGTAALPCLLIVASRVSPFPYQLTSREIKAGPSSRRFMSTLFRTWLPPTMKEAEGAAQQEQAAKCILQTGTCFGSLHWRFFCLWLGADLRQKSSSQVLLSGSWAPLEVASFERQLEWRVCCWSNGCLVFPLSFCSGTI